ncbi:MAG: glycoside hydrolase family 2 protein [Eubacterium sp.]|nr:glycoside hydrolase family 2 protein [Eubacterium sp.]
MTGRIYLNDGWYFTEEFTEELLFRNTDGLVPVRVPHTVKELPYHYFDESEYQMLSGYVRTLYAEPEWEGGRVLLTFEGAAHEASLYVNGQPAGTHRCGYTAFTSDISEFLRYGQDNRIVVRLDSRETLDVPPFGFVIDYMTYGGIYRDVYIEVKEPVYIQDVFIRTEQSFAGSLSDDVAECKVLTETEIAGAVDVSGLMLRQGIRKHGCDDCEYTMLGEGPVSAAVLSFDAGKAEVWDTDHPVLYDVKTELFCPERDDVPECVIDEKVTTIGFRTAEFRTDGFYLNGKKKKIRGLNRHQSYPYAGYAMPDSMQRYDAEILKYELGLNAVRTSHYPQAQSFVDRCDEIGLMVFTEIPGWQHIGGAEWKDQAVANVKDMVLQYRNHPSIILWGVRINESEDDDAFYSRTNYMAHALDPGRATGGVRCYKKGSLLEDVFTYNDFSHAGDNAGCEPKSAVTSAPEKPYMVTEYNGHMFPTKSFDCEEHRLEHAIRHANVLDAVASKDDIAGSFGWCMADYNTHRDFGSGDRICHHGVLDMFRNPKLAAFVYASQQDDTPVLEISTSMDIGEHPGSNRGDIFAFTNADSVRMYKNDVFVSEFYPDGKDGLKGKGRYRHLEHPPVPIDDYIGDALEKEEGMPHEKAEAVKALLNQVAKLGLYRLSAKDKIRMAAVSVKYKMSMEDAVDLFKKYVGNWGGAATEYRYEAIKNGEVIKTVTCAPMTKRYLELKVSHTELVEGKSYDVAAVRIRSVDEHGNTLSFANDPVIIDTEGDIEIIGPSVMSLQGGLGGTYVRSLGREGNGRITISSQGGAKESVEFVIVVK